ncbi:hypothetical protein YC2023_119965 [Brassica napus]
MENIQPWETVTVSLGESIGEGESPNRIPPDRLLSLKQKPTDSVKNGGLETSERNLSAGPLPGHKKRLTIAFMNRWFKYIKTDVGRSQNKKN